MTFEIEVNGRLRSVSVERVRGRGGDPPRFRLQVEGRSYVVDAHRTGLSGLSLIFPEEGGASHDVAFADGQGGELTVRLPEACVPVVVNGRRSGRRGEDSGLVDGEQRVVAPMPGRIVRVLVSPGDEVAARQGLVVVEAMKMENELASPKAGCVKDVTVREGMSVEAGRLLVVVE